MNRASFGCDVCENRLQSVAKQLQAICSAFDQFSRIKNSFFLSLSLSQIIVAYWSNGKPFGISLIDIDLSNYRAFIWSKHAYWKIRACLWHYNQELAKFMSELKLPNQKSSFTSNQQKKERKKEKNRRNKSGTVYTMCCKSSFRYRIKYWSGANWANWHDWMHETGAYAQMLFNSLYVHEYMVLAIKRVAARWRGVWAFSSILFMCTLHTVSWMIEHKKAYGLFVQFHYRTENVNKHVYEANKVPWYTTHNAHIYPIWSLVWRCDIDYWT